MRAFLLMNPFVKRKLPIELTSIAVVLMIKHISSAATSSPPFPSPGSPPGLFHALFFGSVGWVRRWQKRYSILSPGKRTFRTFSASGYVKSVSPLILFRAVFSEHPIALIMSFTVRPFRCISAFKLSIANPPFHFDFTFNGNLRLDCTSIKGKSQPSFRIFLSYSVIYY